MYSTTIALSQLIHVHHRCILLISAYVAFITCDYISNTWLIKNVQIELLWDQT